MKTPSKSLDFRIETQGRRNRIVAEQSGREAELTFSDAGEGCIRADHTGVPPEMGGQGVGTALVERLFEYAVQKGVKVVPACSFVAAKMTDHPKWRSVLVD